MRKWARIYLIENSCIGKINPSPFVREGKIALRTREVNELLHPDA